MKGKGQMVYACIYVINGNEKRQAGDTNDDDDESKREGRKTDEGAHMTHQSAALARLVQAIPSGED